ncbi:hypothetical protein HHK36_030533 [Tetracentron sinense]|uniref:BZIP domain-containing protein n=1 Tax=Tetracentron sinense TaxID=13715 RepID=A0A834YCQ0_TETSI|nr:hypothetical protein HHK36_030533 [Tetracentron sinense]
MEAQLAGIPLSGRYSGRTDIVQMPETPQRGSHHRRALSETLFRFPDEILFDDVDFNIAALDIPSEDNDAVPMTVDSGKSDESAGEKVKGKLAGTNHFRSLSLDAAFFESLGFQPGSGGGWEGEKFGGKDVPEKRIHRHSNSMDGSSSSFEADSILESAKKAMGPDRLAELALIDPKRAKRILANRQSAARSKERKIRYTSELERKVQTLQTEATTLSAQVTILQDSVSSEADDDGGVTLLTNFPLEAYFPSYHNARKKNINAIGPLGRWFCTAAQPDGTQCCSLVRDTTSLTAENKELKLRLQGMEQQAHLRDALNDTLREEVQRLKITTGQVQAVNGSTFNRGMPLQFFSESQALCNFGGHQTQQQQQQQQLHMSQSSLNNQNLGGQPQNSSIDFHQRLERLIAEPLSIDDLKKYFQFTFMVIGNMIMSLETAGEEQE